MYTIENEFLRVSAEDDGAQLSSVELKESGKEFLWQGDPSVWYGRAPVLFPIIGQLLDGKYRYNGREYEMPKHGFARHSVFAHEVCGVPIEFQIHLPGQAGQSTGIPPLSA